MADDDNPLSELIRVIDDSLKHGKAETEEILRYLADVDFQNEVLSHFGRLHNDIEERNRIDTHLKNFEVKFQSAARRQSGLQTMALALGGGLSVTLLGSGVIALATVATGGAILAVPILLGAAGLPASGLYAMHKSDRANDFLEIASHIHDLRERLKVV